MNNEKYQIIAHIDRARKVVDVIVGNRLNPEIWIEKIAPLDETNADDICKNLINLCIDELEKNEHDYGAFLEGMDRARKLLLHKGA